MKAVQQNGLFSGLVAGGFDGGAKNKRKYFPVSRCSVNIKRKDVKGVSSINTLKSSCLVSHHSELCSSSAACRKRVLTVNCSQSCSDYDKGPYKMLIISLVASRMAFYSGDVKSELVLLALPAVVGQALDPLAQLLETAYIGRLGPLELASTGISISIFNIISKIFNVPLLSVTTSFVAEDIAKNSTRQHDFANEIRGTAISLSESLGCSCSCYYSGCSRCFPWF
ncbi:hypothetical protein IHE45_18G037500 [Dioscorea alata]|uniref:Uncharacterized protein n=1 Tax=Dioscorea alata TaxID=55571 RepID=A0ACB7U693_DIOAL|nr:hypothetical protein IHE45_18G037500 [Dioscorea alata]